MSYWMACLQALGYLALIAAIVALFALFIWLGGNWWLIPTGIAFIALFGFAIWVDQ